MKILIIEDELNMRTFIKRGLAAELFIVDDVGLGEQGIHLATTNHYDAIVLDFHLPDMTGLEVMHAIRKEHSSIPIMVLSAELDMDIKVAMLSQCDDYVTKPFSLREIIVRLHALMRRGEVVLGPLLSEGNLEMDTMKHKVTLDGESLVLRNKEFALLEYFLRNIDVVLSREMILEHVWDTNVDLFTNTVDVHVRLLRKKLHQGNHNYIHTVPKRGYCFKFES